MQGRTTGGQEVSRSKGQSSLTGKLCKRHEEGKGASNKLPFFLGTCGPSSFNEEINRKRVVKEEGRLRSARYESVGFSPGRLQEHGDSLTKLCGRNHRGGIPMTGQNEGKEEKGLENRKRSRKGGGGTKGNIFRCSREK